MECAVRYSLQQVSDRLEIEDLIADYADAIDQGDIDALDNIFTPDAAIDYSAMGGAKGGYPEVKVFLKKSLPAFKNTQHLIANYQIKLDGDRATGKIMCFNPMQLAGDIPVFFLGLWYLDEYVRTPAGWRISKRSEQKSWSYNTPSFINL